MNDEYYERERVANDAIAAQKNLRHSSYAMRQLMRWHYEAVAARIKTSGDVVELGCGVGDFVECMSTHGLQNRLIALDLSPECVALAQQRVAPGAADWVTCLTCAAEHAPEAIARAVPDAWIQSVVMRGLVHHVPEPEALFRAAYRCLEPGGRMIVLEGNRSSAYRRFALSFADAIGVRHELSEFGHTPPEQAIPKMRAAGFEQVQWTTLPGLFAPFAYINFGGRGFWRMADAIGGALHGLAPMFTGWWYLAVADKSDASWSGGAPERLSGSPEAGDGK